MTAYEKTLLLREVKQTYVSVVVCQAEFFQESIRSLPDELKEQIKNNPKYSGLFAEWRVK